MLRTERAHELGVVEFTRLCYPGNRFSDGGLVQIDETVSRKPLACLFEPSIEDASRGFPATDDEYEYSYARLVEAKIIPLTLLLPIPEQRKPELHPLNTRMAALCRKFNLPIANVDLSSLDSLAGRFQVVHTTYEGSQIIADQLVPQIKTALSGFSFNNVSAELRASHEIPLQIHTLQPTPWLQKAPFFLDLVPNEYGTKRARFVQLQDIGPFSPTLDSHFEYLDSPDRSFQGNVSVWNPYCHYTRRIICYNFRCATRGQRNR